jgi:hypothetical protein|tara:strand:- start:756 stop:1328 length:573 start_codon:yes stop_codon:yes gene_type:complete
MTTKSLNEKLAYIQAKFHSKKTRYNSFGKYYFRSAEDILEAIKPFLITLGVSVRIKEEYISMENPYGFSGMVPMILSTAIISNGNEEITATAIVGVDLNQKGMQVPQQFGSASSYGKKYSLQNLLLIDDTLDADATNDHGVKDHAYSKKPSLLRGTKEFNAAKKYIIDGNDIETIKKKYNVSPEIEKELL